MLGAGYIETEHGFCIDDEFRDRMPPAGDAADRELDAAIRASGGAFSTDQHALRIAVYPDGEAVMRVLWDGHRRYAICKDRGLPFDVVEDEFPSRAAALYAMDSYQIRRRNTNPNERAVIRARMVKFQEGGEISRSKIVERVASECKVSEQTVWNDMAFAAAIEKLHPKLKKRAVNEFRREDVKTLATYHMDDQLAFVNKVDDGEIASLKIALHGEPAKPDKVVASKPEPPRAKPGRKKNDATEGMEPWRIAKKTAESTLSAAMRAIDDLNAHRRNPGVHQILIAQVKGVISKVENWR